MNKYHWKRDLPDIRDHKIRSSTNFKLIEPTSIPSLIDLRPKCSPVFDQGDIGSCTANSLVAALEYLENSQNELLEDGKFAHLSRIFVYYNERVIEKDVDKDNGAQISDGIKVLINIGACVEQDCPYIVTAFAVKPSDAAYQDAVKHRIVGYARVDQNIDAMKHALASGYPIAFGFEVFDAFESDEVASTGILNMPGKLEKNQGGHAVLMVGYDDATQRVLVRNSWGPDWGQGGYFTMPYSYVTNPNLASDFWCITK